MHMMAVHQVFQAKLFCSMDKSGQDADDFKELHTATNLALHDTKATREAICKAMANLVVLKPHLWLDLIEIRDVDKVETVLPTHRWVC